MLEDSIDRDGQVRRSILIARAGLCLAVIASGLGLRGYGLQLGLPAFTVKYGGSMLWGTTVFFLVASAAPNLSRPSIALIEAAIASCVELFRLVHFPWLDEFRLTLPGALLLGRVFSVWNMVAYGVGIGLGVWLDFRMQASRRNDQGLQIAPDVDAAQAEFPWLRPGAPEWRIATASPCAPSSSPFFSRFSCRFS